jgi:hypothetical protein
MCAYKINMQILLTILNLTAFSRGCADHFGSYDMRDGKTYPLLPPLELHNGGAGDLALP